MFNEYCFEILLESEEKNGAKIQNRFKFIFRFLTVPHCRAKMDYIQSLVTMFYCYFRPLVKWFLRQTTRLCELQRICYGEAAGAARTCGVGKHCDLAELTRRKLYF